MTSVLVPPAVAFWNVGRFLLLFAGQKEVKKEIFSVPLRSCRGLRHDKKSLNLPEIYNTPLSCVKNIFYLRSFKTQQMKIFYPNNIWRFLLLIVVSLLVTSPIVGLSEVIDASSLQIIMMVVLCLAMTVIYYFAAKKSGYQWLQKSELRINITLREVLWGVCFGVLFTLGVFTYDRFVTGGDAASHINVISFVGAVLLGPIIEEWIFRGIFLKSMLTKTNERNAILISAIVFGLVHMGASLNPVKIVGAIGLGYYFGHIYAKRGSLVNAIILHSVVNAIGLVGVHFLYQL